ncbi:hypothetical protein HNQ79_005641 [Streptomyces candidus]|jgi:hypothetical protein|uniref:Uncharacterized protein n=1 Tax=Streptomyces candidus TaxID=67283 RepID=A0A7X0HMJ1_9ACTN|nr:hypothetical protein [Streptomyces candidus]
MENNTLAALSGASGAIIATVVVVIGIAAALYVRLKK